MRLVGQIPAELLRRDAQTRLLEAARERFGAERVAQAAIDGKTLELAVRMALGTNEWSPR